MRPSAGMSGYHRLALRLNKFPQGAPPSKALYAILSMLFSPQEADLVSKLPIRVFTARRAAKAWGMGVPAARRALDRLCSKALLVDIEQEGRMTYCLPPPMAGFFEFSLMRRRTDIDQKALARHLYRYINMDEDFAAALFARGHTQLGRVFVNESQIPPGYELEVLDHERASDAIATARAIGVSRCYCRHKMALAHKVCDAPQDICLTLNLTAESLVRHGHARPIESGEALDILATARAKGLVQFGENVRREVNFICNCCKCCCEGMVAARRFAMQHPVNTTNFLAAIDPETCKGCGQCARICPIEAIATDAGSSKAPAVARLDPDLCLGCGLCAQTCPTAAIRLVPRARRAVTPLNTAHRVVLMAIERNTLQHIIFDNQVLHSHRALAVLLGVIIKLPPVQRLLASRQLRSRYLAAVVQRLHWQPVGANSHTST
jgi:NAD-dependent dihydropyrimidine dehydrogenase PreA subunit